MNLTNISQVKIHRTAAKTDGAGTHAAAAQNLLFWKQHPSGRIHSAAVFGLTPVA
jgi:hypothetical protein